MSLSRADVEKVSLLARLKLSEQELGTMTSQLTAIVDYVEQLKELNTSGVEPMAHAVELRNVFADDALRPSLPREAALANAPKKDDEYYRVPAVLGE
jgi:aspartyl-tRNA(Asn)/glutamyl-tRNA(Gln) amidotransferase subunit C